MITTQGKTNIAVYTEIMEALVKQGKRCRNGVTCLHRDDEGNHCSVGHLLPEGPLMHSTERISDLVDLFDDLGPNDSFIRSNIDDMDLLQQLHDDGAKGWYFIDQGVPEHLIEKWLGIIAA